MYITTVKVSGMMCGMCEAHVNDAVRAAFDVKKVRSSRAKGETVLETEEMPDLDKLTEVINATGYRAADARTEQREKKRLFGR